MLCIHKTNISERRCYLCRPLTQREKELAASQEDLTFADLHAEDNHAQLERNCHAKTL